MDTRWRYDIVRKESEKAIYWLEAAPELSVAKARVEELLSFWPGEYQIFDLETKQAVLTTSDLCAMPVEMPVSNAAE
jgi:hypothetical protein